MELKDVIREARDNKSLKQEDVAKMAKVTVQTYRKWEAGKTEPKASQVAILSQVLGISTNEICNGQKSKKLEIMEFMRIASNLSHNISMFDQQTAIWESIDDDKRYLNNLKKYKDSLNQLPEEMREEMIKRQQIIEDYEYEERELNEEAENHHSHG